MFYLNLWNKIKYFKHIASVHLNSFPGFLDIQANMLRIHKLQRNNIRANILKWTQFSVTQRK